MKRSILFMVLVSVLSIGMVSANSEIELRKDLPIRPIPSSMGNNLSTTATISDLELAIYFETSIGDATITVTDDSSQVVYIETVNTDSNPEIHIPVDLWNKGNYNLTITYTNTTLRGDFTLE